MAGLQDLLLLRQLQDQADPVRSAFQSLADGVSRGIEEGRIEQQKKKAAQEEFNRFLQASGGDSLNTNSNIIRKIEYEEDKGTSIKYILPTEKELQEKKKLDLEVMKLEDELKIVGALGSEEIQSPVLQTQSVQETPITSRPQPISGEISRAEKTVVPSMTIQGRKIIDIPATKEVQRAEAEVKGEEKGIITWADEAAQRQVKVNVINPKLNYYMDVGGRAYNELKTEAKDKYGVDLDFTEGGTNYYKNLLVKKGLQIGKYIPLMTALDRLRPELGVELMRQLGAFRSGSMAKRFENTLAQFNGNIKEDIANMVTTIAKNAANTELIDENGNVLPDEVRDKKMRMAEASLIREYNYAYRNMGLIKKPYLAGRSYEWVAENASFNEEAEKRIQEAMAANPGYSRVAVTAKLIEQGLL